MYTDYCLRFKDEVEADSVLFEGEERRAKYAAIDVIGVIHKPTGKVLTTDEGEVPEMAPLPGWHVNVRHTEPAPELEPFRVEVKTPARGWFEAPAPRPPASARRRESSPLTKRGKRVTKP